VSPIQAKASSDSSCALLPVVGRGTEDAAAAEERKEEERKEEEEKEGEKAEEEEAPAACLPVAALAALRPPCSAALRRGGATVELPAAAECRREALGSLLRLPASLPGRALLSSL
jgi:hypothetical protein